MRSFITIRLSCSNCIPDYLLPIALAIKKLINILWQNVVCQSVAAFD